MKQLIILVLLCLTFEVIAQKSFEVDSVKKLIEGDLENYNQNQFKKLLRKAANLADSEIRNNTFELNSYTKYSNGFHIIFIGRSTQNYFYERIIIYDKFYKQTDFMEYIKGCQVCKETDTFTRVSLSTDRKTLIEVFSVYYFLSSKFPIGIPDSKEAIKVDSFYIDLKGKIKRI